MWLLGTGLCNYAELCLAYCVMMCELSSEVFCNNLNAPYRPG